MTQPGCGDGRPRSFGARPSGRPLSRPLGRPAGVPFGPGTPAGHPIYGGCRSILASIRLTNTREVEESRLWFRRMAR